MKNGMAECAVCHSKLVSPTVKTISKAYDQHRDYPVLVFMSKVDGKFKFNPVSVNFFTEATKVVFAIIMLLIQAARNNVLLAVPELLDAINNYLKFIMQLYFNPATVKMLSNLKVLVIAVLLKLIMNRRFSLIQGKLYTHIIGLIMLQWGALALLLIGISISQLRSLPEGATSLALPVTTIAYIYTLIFVTSFSGLSIQ
ncbi:hypothetical protein P3S67_007744 [Capsicum chacoense]